MIQFWLRLIGWGALALGTIQTITTFGFLGIWSLSGIVGGGIVTCIFFAFAKIIDLLETISVRLRRQNSLEDI